MYAEVVFEDNLLDDVIIINPELPKEAENKHISIIKRFVNHVIT